MRSCHVILRIFRITEQLAYCLKVGIRPGRLPQTPSASSHHRGQVLHEKSDIHFELKTCFFSLFALVVKSSQKPHAWLRDKTDTSAGIFSAGSSEVCRLFLKIILILTCPYHYPCKHSICTLFCCISFLIFLPLLCLRESLILYNNNIFFP